MTNKYINFYNNLVKLARNKNLYRDFTSQDTFVDRLILLLFHFAFFLNIFKSNNNKKTLQETFDFFFKQIELNLREMGYGDPTVNKRMKSYINIFYSILSEIDDWDKINKIQKNQIISKYIKINKKTLIFSDYFNNYRDYLKNNTLNSLLKGVIKPNF